MPTIDVEFDIMDYIDEFSTQALEFELTKRYKGNPAGDYSNEEILMQNLYYALRDRDIDAIIKAANPILDRNLGKQV